MAESFEVAPGVFTDKPRDQLTAEDLAGLAGTPSSVTTTDVNPDVATAVLQQNPNINVPTTAPAATQVAQAANPNAVAPVMIPGTTTVDPFATAVAQATADKATAEAAGLTGEALQAFETNLATAQQTQSDAGRDIQAAFPELGLTPANIATQQGQQAQTPQLPTGTQFDPTLLQTQEGEFLDPDQILGGVRDVTAPLSQAPTFTVSDQAAASLLNISPATYQAFTAEGVTGEVTPASLVRYQLGLLMKDVDEGTAFWAQGAINKANEAMIARGIGASTIAGAAISQAILEAAVPIATQDAKTFGEMNLQNLRNRQQSLLSNQAAINAAKQFNAASENDINKFMTELRDRIIRFNVEQSNAMGRFNTEQANAVGQFNAQLISQRDQFLATNQLTIAKSNTEWRRSVNTANTAAINAANFVNVQNKFNMSQQAIANLWQSARDISQNALISGRDEADRAFTLTLESLFDERFLRDLDREQTTAMVAGIADVVIGALSSDSFGNFVSGFFDDDDEAPNTGLGPTGTI